MISAEFSTKMNSASKDSAVVISQCESVIEKRAGRSPNLTSEFEIFQIWPQVGGFLRVGEVIYEFLEKTANGLFKVGRPIDLILSKIKR